MKPEPAPVIDSSPITQGTIPTVVVPSAPTPPVIAGAVLKVILALLAVPAEAPNEAARTSNVPSAVLVSCEPAN